MIRPDRVPVALSAILPTPPPHVGVPYLVGSGKSADKTSAVNLDVSAE